MWAGSQNVVDGEVDGDGVGRGGGEGGDLGGMSLRFEATCSAAGTSRSYWWMSNVSQQKNYMWRE